jgi:hypothetical protein
MSRRKAGKCPNDLLALLCVFPGMVPYVSIGCVTLKICENEISNRKIMKAAGTLPSMLGKCPSYSLLCGSFPKLILLTCPLLQNQKRPEQRYIQGGELNRGLKRFFFTI